MTGDLARCGVPEYKSDVGNQVSGKMVRIHHGPAAVSGDGLAECH